MKNAALLKNQKTYTIPFILLHGGGYLATKNLEFQSYEELDSDLLDINKYEKMYIDVEHAKYLQEHPKMKQNKVKTKANLNYRFAILLKYFNSGNNEEEEWAKNRIWVESAAYIKSFLKKCNITEKNLYEEILQDCYVTLFDEIKNFNNENKLTTFLTYQLQHTVTYALSTYLSGTSVYYANNIKVVKKAIRKLESYGINDPSYAEIAEIAGSNMTVQKVEDTITRMNLTSMISLEDAMNYYSDNPSPREIVIKNEETRILYEAIETLSDYERDCLKMFYGIGMDKEFITNLLKGLPEDKKPLVKKALIKDGFSVSAIAKIKNDAAPKIQRIIDRACRKLSKNKNLSSFFNPYIVKPSHDSITKQESITKFFASIDDENEILDGIK